MTSDSNNALLSVSDDRRPPLQRGLMNFQLQNFQRLLQYFCNLNSPKNFTCPSGKLKTEFTSLIAKSTSPGYWTQRSFHAEGGNFNFTVNCNYVSLQVTKHASLPPPNIRGTVSESNPVNADTKGAIESVHINGVSV